MRVVTLEPAELELLRAVAVLSSDSPLPDWKNVNAVCDRLADYGFLKNVQVGWQITPRGHRTVVRTADIPKGFAVSVPAYDPGPPLK